MSAPDMRRWCPDCGGCGANEAGLACSRCKGAGKLDPFADWPLPAPSLSADTEEA